MESFAARGAADSIRDIAQAAQPLPQQLYTLSVTNDSYSEDIRIIANDLKTFSLSLNTLSRLLGDSKSRYSDYIFRLIADIIKKSGKIHDKVRKIMEKLSNNGKGTWKLGVKFVYMESQIRKLLSGLRDMKVRLVNISQILQADLQLNDDMSIPITSKIQRPPGKSLQPETLRILQKAQKSILPKGVTNNKHSTEPIHGSRNNTHISITHNEDHQLEGPGFFLLSNTAIDPTLNLPEYLNYHESSTSPFTTTKAPLALPPNISDLPPVVERDLKSQSTFRSIDAPKETTYDATKHGITPSTGPTPQPPEDDFSASRSVKSSPSVDSFKTAMSVQEHDGQIARKVKGIQSVMHAFRTAMQTLSSLIDSRISKTDGELFVAAKGLESSLNDGMVEIDRHHINYFKQYGHIYLQLFDTSLSHDIHSIGSEIMTNVVVKLLESLAEHEELHAYQFDSLSKYVKEISFRTNHCLTFLASNVVIESKSDVISSSTASGSSKAIGLNESGNRHYNTATLSDNRDELVSAVDLSSRKDFELRSSSNRSRGWSAIAASIISTGMRTAGANSSDNNTESSWGWFDRKKFMPLSRKNTIVDPQNFGPTNSLHGLVTEPVGFSKVPSWTSSSDFGEQRDRYPKSQAPIDGLGTSQQSLQQVYPVPISDPNVFAAGRASRGPETSREESLAYIHPRPHPIPIQQPLPLIPISQSAYESIYPFRSESDGILKKTVSSRRTPPLAQTILTGVSGAALDSAIASSNKHDRNDVKRVDDYESPANEIQKRWESESADAARGAGRREPGRNILEHHDAEMRIKRPDFHDHYTKSEVAISTASIDPFENQVEDGSFSNPTAGSSTDFHIPSMVTVEPKPDFTRIQHYSTRYPSVISNAGLEVEYPDKDESNKQSSDKEIDTSHGYHGAVMEPEKFLTRNSPPQREKDQNLPSTGPKPSAPQFSHLPGAFDDDLDFTSTTATGLQNAGFDPNIVIDDPSIRRRAPPAGSIIPGIYYAPFAETVSDLNDTRSPFMTNFEPEDAVENPVEESDSWFIPSKKSKKKMSRKEVPDTSDKEQKVFVLVDAFDDLKTGEDGWTVTKKSKKDKKKRKSQLWDSPPGFRDVVSDQRQLSRSIDSSERQTELYEAQLEEDSLLTSRASKKSHDENYNESKSRKSSDRDDDIFDSADRDQPQSLAPVDTSPYVDSTSRRKKKSRTTSSEDENRKSRNSKRYSVHDASSLYSSLGAETVGDLPGSASDESNGKYHYEDDFSDDVRNDGKNRRKSASRFRNITSTKKDTFLDNAGTIGAGIGIAGAAAAITVQHHRQSKAPNTTVETSEQIQSINTENFAMTDEIIEPESTEWRFRPSIDPQYGDLLPLPPSDPTSPSIEFFEELPALPESRPDTPDSERLSRDKGIEATVRALQEIPMKSSSQRSIPLVFKLGNRGAPSSPAALRSSDSQSPVVPKTDPPDHPNPRYRQPISWDKSANYKPLFLVERNPAVQIQDLDDVSPELSSIKQESPSTDELKLNKHQKAGDEYQAMPPKPSPINPMTKDRSSYLLQSSPIFEKISDNRDALHIIQERESTDVLLPTVGPEFTNEPLSPLSEEAELTPTPKHKKGKKEKKKRSSAAWSEDEEIKATGERLAARQEMAGRKMEQKSKDSNPLIQAENEYGNDKRTDAGPPKNDTESDTSKLSSIALPFHSNLSTLEIDTSNEHTVSTLAYPALSSNQKGKLWWQAYASLIPSSSTSSSESLPFTLIKKGLQSELGIPVSKHLPDNTICWYTSNSIRRISTALHHDKPQLAEVLEIRSNILRIVTTMEIQLGLEIAALGWGCVLALLSLYEKVIAASIDATSTAFLETSLTHLKIIVAIIARHTVMENLSQQTGDTLSFKAEYRSALISLCTQILEYLAITFDYAKTEISVLTEGNGGRKDTQRNVYLIENQRQEGLQKCAFLVELIKQKDETCQKYGVVVDMKDESSSESDESDNIKVGDASDEDWD